MGGRGAGREDWAGWSGCCVDGTDGTREECAAEREENRSGEHFGGVEATVHELGVGWDLDGLVMVQGGKYCLVISVDRPVRERDEGGV